MDILDSLIEDARATKAARAKKKKDLPAPILPAEETALQRECHTSNMIAERLKHMIGWKWEARVVFIHTQTCRTCGLSSSFIALDGVRRYNPRLYLSETLRMVDPEPRGIALPFEIEEHFFSVEQCANCLRLAQQLEESYFLTHSLRGKPIQLEMFT